MDSIISKLLQLQLQIKIFHWQTNSYAEHIAYGDFYALLDGLLDTLAETYQGSANTKLQFNHGFELKNINEVNIDNVLNKTSDLLKVEFKEFEEMSDIMNLRDEILNSVNKLKYLLKLK